ncbi:hypothetical protein FACS189459_2120 [Bacilli bacterium]|nr:hypothetical protein FACS189459_2120 [Bacilli bacterium]
MVRANIFSVIPFFFGSILAPFITVMAMFAFQIPFTENISLMIVLIFAISTVLTYLTITNIITKELKFNIFNRKQLIDNIKLNSLANFKTTLPLIILLLVISILMIVTSSTSVIFIFAGMAIFLVFSVVISYYIMPMLLMLFISIRYKYLNVVYKISIFGNTKYDKINEESIDSINSFSRRKIVNHIEEK